MTEAARLEHRITVALGARRIAPEDLETIIGELQTAADEAEEAAAAERERADDILAGPGVEEAHRRVVAAELTARRYRAALPRLREKLSTALREKQGERWLADGLRVQDQRDAAVERFKRLPRLFAEIVAILKEAEAVDREVDRINHTAPASENRRIWPVELEARGLDSFSTANPSIAKELRLPAWEQGAPALWPPPQVPFGAYAAFVAAPAAHAGPDWFRNQEARARAARADAVRVARYYAQEQREREERENRNRLR